MATFLIQKFQHPVVAGSVQACALLNVFDIIAVRADTWVWGDQELTNPWFRLLQWSAVSVSDAQALISPLPITYDSSGRPMTLWRSRANFFNVSDARVPSALKTWWQDDTRAVPMFVVPATFTAANLADLTVARAPISDPNYNGGATAAAITA